MEAQSKPTAPEPWHKAVNRMADPKFLSLPPLARAALYMIEDLNATGTPIVGNRSRLCHMLNLEPKHAYVALDPLREKGFIVVDEIDGQWVVNLPPTHPQHARNMPATILQHARNGKKKTASNAASGDRSLKENKRVVADATTEPESYDSGEIEITPTLTSGTPTAAVASVDNLAEQKRLLTDLLPDHGEAIWDYLWRHSLEDRRIKDRDAYMAKSVASLQDRVAKSSAAVVEFAWGKTMAKGAMWAFADKIVSSEIKRALATNGGQADQKAPAIQIPADMTAITARLMSINSGHADTDEDKTYVLRGLIAHGEAEKAKKWADQWGMCL